jgi:hypothetical protein
MRDEAIVRRRECSVIAVQQSWNDEGGIGAKRNKERCIRRVGAHSG